MEKGLSQCMHNYDFNTVYATCEQINTVQLKEQFEKGGYTAYDSTVDVRVTADDDVAVTVKGISANNGVWIMEVCIV